MKGQFEVQESTLYWVLSLFLPFPSCLWDPLSMFGLFATFGIFSPGLILFVVWAVPHIYFHSYFFE